MKRIAFFLYSLSGGGTERVNINLMNQLCRHGYSVYLAVIRRDGEFAGMLSSEIRVVDLGCQHAFSSIRPLSQFLRAVRPHVLFSAFPTLNVVALTANVLAGRLTAAIPTEHLPVTADAAENPSMGPRLAYRLYPILYRTAAAVVVNCEDSAKDFRCRYPGIADERLRVIHNPVVSGEIETSVQDRQQWEKPRDVDSPVILGVGRLTRVKNFELLIDAFALIRSQLDCRLVILGEGEQRGALLSRIKELGVEGDVAMPGFVHNPYAMMSRASVFVLSSIYETLPTVLIEALACGVRTVSTDCFGVREILGDGRYGTIVSERNAQTLASAIRASLAMPVDSAMLLQRSRDFSVERAVQRYRDLIEEVSA